MQKSLLTSFISKYSLGGAIESVVWEGTEAGLRTKMISDDKSLLGEIELKKSDTPELEGKKLGIFKTSQISKLMGVLGDDIDISLNIISDAPKALKMGDKTAKTNYALSDLAIIPNVPALKAENIPSEFEVSIKVNSDFISTFTKAKAALPEVVTFAVHSTAKKVELILGQTDVNTNTVTLNVESNKASVIDKLFFNADLFKEVLLANKEADAEFLISKEGLGKIVYDTKEYKAIYYLVAKTQN